MRGARLPVRLGLEGVPREPGSVCGIALPAGLRESDRLPEPIFTPATKAELGEHDENVDFERAAEIVGDRGLMEELRRLSLELYAFAAAHAERNGIILADTKFEFGRDSDGDDRARRRGADAGLLALLAARPLRARRLAAVVRQAVRARLARRSRAGTTRRPAPSCRPRSSTNTRAKYVEAYERLAGEPFERWLKSLRVRVLIRPKEGILDPQGQAVERALPALGYEGVSNVHVGRLIELEVGRRRRRRTARVEEMCERLLANPLIESYEVAAARR